MATFLFYSTYVVAGSQRNRRVWGSKVKGLFQEYRQSRPTRRAKQKQPAVRPQSGSQREARAFCETRESAVWPVLACEERGRGLEGVEVGGAWRGWRWEGPGGNK